jgi:nucleotide-binding universal stress UspA family protein
VSRRGSNDDLNDGLTVLVGWDGSADAATAIEVGALLFPDARAHIAHIWTPPFTAHPSPALLRRAGTVDGLIELLDRQGRARAEEITAEGVRRAQAAGWRAQPLARRTFASEGLELGRLAEELHPLVVIVGARGLSGVRAVLGSVSDTVVHYSPVPALVVPRPGTHSAAAHTGPVLVAYDGSSGADTALAAATSLWPSRRIVVASVASEAADSIASVGAIEPVTLKAEGVPETARSVADALALHAAAIGAAAIAVGSRGRSAHREILLGSVAMATLHHAHRAVLAVPPPNRLARDEPAIVAAGGEIAG